MGYVALEHLTWGDGSIEPGEPVPVDEPGRDYGAMVRLGMIAETHGAAAQSDDELREELAVAHREIADLRAKLAAAEAAEGEGKAEPEVSEADNAAKAAAADGGSAAESTGAPAEPVSYAALKQPQLKEQLDQRGIECPKGPIRNAVLIEMLEADDAAKAAAAS